MDGTYVVEDDPVGVEKSNTRRRWESKFHLRDVILLGRNAQMDVQSVRSAVETPIACVRRLDERVEVRLNFLVGEAAPVDRQTKRLVLGRGTKPSRHARPWDTVAHAYRVRGFVMNMRGQLVSNGGNQLVQVRRERLQLNLRLFER